MRYVIQDLRYGIRTLRQTPTFTIAAVLTLASAIAAVSTVLSLGYTLLLRPVPVDDAERLVAVTSTRSRGRDLGLVSYPDYVYFRDTTRTVAELAAQYGTAPLWVVAHDRSEEINGAVVTANFFSLLRLRPAFGRFFRPEEDQVPDRDRVAIISHRLWRDWFGSSSDALGAVVRVNGTPFTVIGVAPEQWRGLASMPAEIYLPMMMVRVGYRFCDVLLADCTILDMVGRLGPGQTFQDAQAELATLVPAGWTSAEEGRNSGIAVSLLRGADYRAAQESTRMVTVLILIAGVLLLVCCANLAGLLMSRGRARTRELAIRVSLGASSQRLLGQLITESMLLALAGGISGVIASVGLIQSIQAMFYVSDVEGHPLAFDFSLDPLVVAAVLLVSVFAAMLFGLAPAMWSIRQSGSEDLRRRTSGAIAWRSGRWLVGLQTAVAVALASISTLLISDVVSNSARGQMDVSQVVSLRLRPRLVGYPPERAQEFLKRVVEQLQALAVVESVTMVDRGGVLQQLDATVSLPGDDHAASIPVRYGEVGTRYFETFAMPVLRGREFVDTDSPSTRPVAIVNETLARRLWPGGDAVGRHVIVNGSVREVVGVVGDFPIYTRTTGPQPYAYTPYWQSANRVDARVAVRVKGDPGEALRTFVRAIGGVDSAVPVSEIVTVPFQLAQGTFQPLRLTATFLGYTASIAVILCVMGLYATLAIAVSGRTREIGIRVALGAESHTILGMILRQGLIVVAVGILGGIGLAVAGVQLVRDLLYGFGPSDAASYATVALLMLGVGLIASFVPARRAAQVSPAVALRHE